MRKELFEQIDTAISEELASAKEKFSTNHSRHESYAVLLEEFQEMQAEVEYLKYRIALAWSLTKENATSNKLLENLTQAKTRSRNMVAEAIQTAAMIDKFIEYVDSEIQENQPAGRIRKEEKDTEYESEGFDK